MSHEPPDPFRVTLDHEKPVEPVEPIGPIVLMDGRRSLGPAVNASARVRLTIEFDSGQSWGVGCPVEQIYKQARDCAIGRLRTLLNTNANANPGVPFPVRIIGEPEVQAIITEPKR